MATSSCVVQGGGAKPLTLFPLVSFVWCFVWRGGGVPNSDDLLKLLIAEGHRELQSDHRALVGTPGSIDTEHKCGGDYIYFGIKKGIVSYTKLHLLLLMGTVRHAVSYFLALGGCLITCV
jgi:hypothetical protein